MTLFEHTSRRLWTPKTSNMTRHFRKLGLALLLAAALWLLVSMLGVSSSLIARLETGMPMAYIGWAVLIVYVILLAIPFVPSAGGQPRCAPVFRATTPAVTTERG